jgi:hypothetical protein
VTAVIIGSSSAGISFLQDPATGNLNFCAILVDEKVADGILADAL